MNMIIESLNGWSVRFADFALAMLLQSTVLIVFLLGIDLALRKRVRATVRYAVWLLVLVKLALPPSLALPTGLAYWMPARTTHPVSAPTVISPPVAATPERSFATVDTSPMVVTPSVAPIPHRPRFTGSSVLFLGWLAAMLGLAVWTSRRLKLVAGIVRQSVTAPEHLETLLESCRLQLGIKRRIPVRCAPIGSPAICGLFRPVILIPPALVENLDEPEMRSVLLHELAHYKRGDLWVSHAQMIFQIAYWYNPLLWMANARIRRTREQAVDEMVLVEMGMEPQTYSATLLQVARLGLARRHAAVGLMGILEPGRGLTQRILLMMSRPLPRTARLGARGLVIVLALTLLLLPMACRPKTDVHPQNELTLVMSKEGTITLQNQTIPFDQLPQKLTNITRQNPGTTLAVQAERGTPWEKVVKVFEAAKAAHINVISAVAKPTAATDWSGKTFREPFPIRPIMRGNLSPEAVDALEARLVEDPEDFDARRDLINHYGFRDRGAKAKHILWIIDHHPEFSMSGPGMSIDPIMEESAYRQGKKLWLQHVSEHPTNTVILGNAAAYCNLADASTSEELLLKAQALEPNNPSWSDQLGHLYSRGPGTNAAAKALAEFERAHTQASVPGDPKLEYLAKMALAASDLTKARTYATELLGPGLEWNRGGNAGSALFHGNIILGRIALREGKLDDAKHYLLEAGKTKGSPTLGSFGPNMALAKDLLEKGETNTVLEYFHECEQFWTLSGNNEKLAKWTADVKAGNTPDFGANLIY